MYISNKEKFKLFLQQFMVFCCLPLIYFGSWIFIFIFKKYKIPQISELRKQFKEITKQINNNPLLICPNHLTYIDSLLLVIIFSSFFEYFKNFHTFAWNFPKLTHVKKNLFFQLIGYLGKCIFINFEKPNNNNDQITNTAKYLLFKGQYIMLFPEGHRSINSLVDTKNFAYGVGKLIKEITNTKILCVYLRGNTQKYSSNFPNKYDQFYCKMELFNPLTLDLPHNNIDSNNFRTSKSSNNSELRKIRDIAKNIVEHLSIMEKNYFTIINK